MITTNELRTIKMPSDTEVDLKRILGKCKQMSYKGQYSCCFTIPFLLEEISSLRKKLENLGFSVYVNWKEDYFEVSWI